MLLTNNAQVDLVNIDGTSPLMITSVIGGMDIVKVLLENNAQVDLQDKDRMSSFNVCK